MGSGRDGSPAPAAGSIDTRSGARGSGLRWSENARSFEFEDPGVHNMDMKNLEHASIRATRRSIRKAVRNPEGHELDSTDKFEISHHEWNGNNGVRCSSKGMAETPVDNCCPDDKGGWQNVMKAFRDARVAEMADQIDPIHEAPYRHLKSPRAGKLVSLGLRDDDVDAQQLQNKGGRASRRHGDSPKRMRASDEMQELLNELREESFGQQKAIPPTPTSPKQGRDPPENNPKKSDKFPLRTYKSPGRPRSVEALQDGYDNGAQRRPKTRRHKRKEPEVQPNAAVHATTSRLESPRPHQSSFVQRFGLMKDVSSLRTRSWLHLITELIMWKDVSRSSFVFGAGCFCILSVSYTEDMRCGTLTMIANIALFYLGAAFFHRNFVRSDASNPLTSDWELSEAEALDFLRIILPALNLVLTKCAQLFSGDPATTLKVAAVLWLVARTGYFLTVWTFMRLAFLAVFTLPKLYSSYSDQLKWQAQILIDRLWGAWSSCAHKKAALVATFLVVWNLASASTRLFGAFVLVVAFRLYHAHNWSEQAPEDPLPPLKEVKMEPP